MKPKRIIATVTNDLSHDQRMMRIGTTLQQGGYDFLLVGRKKTNSSAPSRQIFSQHQIFCFFQRGKLFYLEYNFRLFWYLLFTSFDAVCAVDLDTLLPAILVSRLKNKPCVYDAHEYFTETPEVVRRPRVKSVWERVARFCIPRVQAAYTVGPQLAALMGERYGFPFSVIRNVPFAKEAFVSAPKPGEPFRLLYQGMLNEGRGLEALIDSAAEWKEGIECTLLGDGDLAEQLRKTVSDRGLSARIRFLGFVPPAEMVKHTLEAHLGLNLLENTGQSYYYSLANKTFDYLQAGLPAIHMDFPEYRYLAETQAHRPGLKTQHLFHLIPNLHPQTLAKAINWLAEDRTYWLQLHNNCLQHRAEHSWEQEQGKLLAIYARLLPSA